MRFLAGAFPVLFAACSLAPAQSSLASRTPSDTLPTGGEKFNYSVEWKLIHAGTVSLEVQKEDASVRLVSAGIVSSLFKIDDVYHVNYREPYCAESSVMDAAEGKRHHETRVTYDR